MGEVRFKMDGANRFFQVPYRMVDEFLLEADALQLRVLLFLLRHNAREVTISELCAAVQSGRAEVETALSFWMGVGVLGERDGYIVLELGEGQEQAKKKAKKASYEPKEVRSRTAGDKEAAEFLRFSENALGRLLTMADTSRLLAMHDELGLAYGAIKLLLEDCRKRDKRGTKYIEKIAESWAEKGIFTQEQVQEQLLREEKKKDSETKLRSMMGIGSRALSATEKKYIEAWTLEFQFPMDTLKLAYDKTVDATGKVAFAYMNKILHTWHEKGLHTPDETMVEGKQETQSDWEKIRAAQKKLW